MGVPITAVPIVANASPPPQPVAAHTLSDFVANLQNIQISGMPNLANPAALAGEVFSNLRGFVEKTHMLQRSLPPVQPSSNMDGSGVNMDSSGVSRSPRAGLDQLQRTADMVLEAMNFTVEVEWVSEGASTLPRTANTLLKGQ